MIQQSPPPPPPFSASNRHESRRIDNQLRGRAGRQGDPGGTRFFLSLEDDIFKIFGADKMSGKSYGK